RALRLTLPPPAFDDFRGLRIAVVASDPVAEVDASVSREIEALASFLSKRKARVSVAAALPVGMAEHDRLYVLLRRAATSMRAHDDAAFARLLDQRDTLDPDDRSYRAEQVRGNTLYHRDWLRLNNERHRLRLAWQEFFRHHDVLLCPSAASTAFVQNRQGERWERTIPVNGRPQPDTTQIFWMGFASVAYLPATQAPIALAADGLPTGVQIVGPQYADLTTIRFAALLEREYYAFRAPPGYD
ncbi:MAG TPA: amidase family protein, partial [Burkholderiales bacterium]